MGCDIHGKIEIFAYSQWCNVLDITWLQDRNYDCFGLLFGVRGYCGFKAIAEQRGIPKDAHEETKKEYMEGLGDYHSASYITLKELLEFDWEKESEELDDRISVFEKKDGKWFYLHKFGWSSSLEGKAESLKELKEKGETIIDNKLYKHCRLKAKDVLSKDWEEIIDIMKTLGKYRKPEEVRLVVWFDN